MFNIAPLLREWQEGVSLSIFLLEEGFDNVLLAFRGFFTKTAGRVFQEPFSSMTSSFVWYKVLTTAFFPGVCFVDVCERVW
jgi:hypothetical protein